MAFYVLKILFSRIFIGHLRHITFSTNVYQVLSTEYQVHTCETLSILLYNSIYLLSFISFSLFFPPHKINCVFSSSFFFLFFFQLCLSYWAETPPIDDRVHWPINISSNINNNIKEFETWDACVRVLTWR